MLINFSIELPIANPLRFTIRDEVDNERANFDQQRYSQTEHTTMERDRYMLPVETGDSPTIQIYNNYPALSLRLLDCTGAEIQAHSPSVFRQFRNKKFRADAKLVGVGENLVVYFDEGFEYLDEDFNESGEFTVWQGRLPNTYIKVGDIARVSIQDLGFEAATITDVVWLPQYNAQGYQLSLLSDIAAPVDGKIEVTYNEKEVDLYAQPLVLTGLAAGIYYVEILAGLSVDAPVLEYLSEPMWVKDLHKETLAIRYRHNGSFNSSEHWSYIYPDNYYNTLRLISKHCGIQPAGEIEVYTDDYGIQKILRGLAYRQIGFTAFNIPSWVADKLNVIFLHDTKIINEYQWEVEDLGSFNIVNFKDVGDYTINLKQVNDRRLFVKSTAVDVIAEFVPPLFDELDSEGDSFTTTFTSNTGEVFSFVSLPDWLSYTVNEGGEPSTNSPFVNGDELHFTVAPNATFFNREVLLIATTPALTELTAALLVQQLFDDTEPLFINASSTNIILGGGSGANQLLEISSSGDYDIVHVSGFAFTVVKENGFSQLRITAPSQNDEPIVRTAVYRLELQSDPSVFVNINVTQAVLKVMISLEPDTIVSNSFGGNLAIDVTVAGNAQWQMVSNQPWIVVDSLIRSGSHAAVPVFVQSKPPYIPPRSGTVTFFNIENISDSVTLTIQQND